MNNTDKSISTSKNRNLGIISRGPSSLLLTKKDLTIRFGGPIVDRKVIDGDLVLDTIGGDLKTDSKFCVIPITDKDFAILNQVMPENKDVPFASVINAARDVLDNCTMLKVYGFFKKYFSFSINNVPVMIVRPTEMYLIVGGRTIRAITNRTGVLYYGNNGWTKTTSIMTLVNLLNKSTTQDKGHDHVVDHGKEIEHGKY